jgi:hypothetical protein
MWRLEKVQILPYSAPLVVVVGLSQILGMGHLFQEPKGGGYGIAGALIK